MIRKLLSILFVIIFSTILYPFGTFAQTEATVNGTVNNHTKMITISGILSSGEGRKVTISVNKRTGELDYVNQSITGHDGSYVFTYKLDENESTIFDISIGGEGVSNPVKTSVTYTPIPVIHIPNIPNIPVTNVLLNKSDLILFVGTNEKLSVEVVPANATDKAVTWKSSNTTVATVDANGKVTAVGEGAALITVTTADSGKTASCKVVVNPVAVASVKLNKTSLALNVGESQSLVATVTPANATNKAVTWSSSNTKVATVDSKGKVTAKAAGNAVITVTTADSGKTASCKVVVNPVAVASVKLNKTSLTLNVGASQSLVATVTPANATNKAVTWNSSNTKVATVDSTGKVTAKSVGKAVITVKTLDDSKTASCITTVKKNVTSIELDKKELKMVVKQKIKLIAAVEPKLGVGQTIKWTTSNKKFATVDSKGNVTAISKGRVEIKATTPDGKFAVCKITIS